MNHENFHTSQLSGEDLKSLQTLEKELGLVMIAVEEDNAVASLSNEQLDKLQSLENRLGKTIIAYKSH